MNGSSHEYAAAFANVCMRFCRMKVAYKPKSKQCQSSNLLSISWGLPPKNSDDELLDWLGFSSSLIVMNPILWKIWHFTNFEGNWMHWNSVKATVKQPPGESHMKFKKTKLKTPKSNFVWKSKLFLIYSIIQETGIELNLTPKFCQRKGYVKYLRLDNYLQKYGYEKGSDFA